jgi:hypothetical protein
MERLWDRVDGIPDEKWGGGVYALYQGQRLVYIGHTANFRVRLHAHRRRFHFDGVKLAPIEDRKERKRLERRLLLRLRPPLNRTLPRSIYDVSYMGSTR